MITDMIGTVSLSVLLIISEPGRFSNIGVFAPLAFL